MKNKESQNNNHRVEKQYKFPKLTQSYKQKPLKINGIVGEAISFFTMHNPEKSKAVFEPGLKITQFSAQTKYNTEQVNKAVKSHRKSQIFAFERYIRRYNHTHYPQAQFLNQPFYQEENPNLLVHPNIVKEKEKKANLSNGSKIIKININNKRVKKKQEKFIEQNYFFCEKMIRSESIHNCFEVSQQKNKNSISEDNLEFETLQKKEDSVIQKIESNLKEKQKSRFNIKFRNKVERKKYKFYIGNGNNESVVKQVLGLRKNWQQTSEHDTLFSLRWQSSTNKVWYSRINVGRFKQYVNHLEFHEQISSKCGLLKTMKKYCSRNSLNCFDFIPISFVFDFDDVTKYEAEMKRFVFYYCENMMNPEMRGRKQRQYIDLIKNIGLSSKPNLSFESINLQGYSSLSSGPYRQKNNYLWIYKPSEQNRGRGIIIFRTLQELAEILKVQERQSNTISSFSVTSVNFNSTQSNNNNNNNNSVGNLQEKLKVKSKQFIIQKYIEKPLLIHNRKFDIRVWVMVVPNGEVYFFQEGYIRTSCQEFNLDESNEYIHLTNNAIQKHSQKYGLYEEGNQLTYDDFDKYFHVDSDENSEATQHKKLYPFKQTLLPKIKEYCKMVIQSCNKKLRNCKNECGFEIFGFDYMVDNEGGLWLIEVNTNPCLQKSSKILSNMIPRMLDDAFKIVLDPQFKVKQRKEQVYHIEGYQDEENMWQFLKNDYEN